MPLQVQALDDLIVITFWMCDITVTYEICCKSKLCL